MGMNGDEWGWMDSARILFIPIHPHSYPYVTVVLKPYHLIIGCTIHYTISLSWVTATFHVFNLVDTFLRIPTNVDEWGWMDRTRILFIPIHPHSDEWVKFNPHSSPFPIHPTCPEISHCWSGMITVSWSADQHQLMLINVDEPLINLD